VNVFAVLLGVESKVFSMELHGSPSRGNYGKADSVSQIMR
jgi:hypothetical protein